MLALCRRLDGDLGPRGRRLMYVNMLEQRDLMLRFNNNGVPRWEDRAMRLAFPVAARWAGKELGIRPGIEVEDEAAVWREFDFVAGLLSDGRPHLCGERFTAADLTFAALSASVIVPPVYGTPLPQPNVLPPQIASMVNRAREHPAGLRPLPLCAQVSLVDAGMDRGLANRNLRTALIAGAIILIVFAASFGVGFIY